MIIGLFYHRAILAVILMSSQASLARPIKFDGVRYGSVEEARAAIKKDLVMKLDTISPDYLKSEKGEPIGGTFAVEIPSLEEVKLKYLWIKRGIFAEPENDLQNLHAERLIQAIKFDFLFYKKLGFIEDVVFTTDENFGYNTTVYDYILSFSTEFDGQRTPQALKYRKTQWFVQRRGGGLKQAANISYGGPINTAILQVFSGLRNAVAILKKANDQTPDQIQGKTNLIVQPSLPQAKTVVDAPVAATVIAPAVKKELNQDAKTSPGTSTSVSRTGVTAQTDDVVLEKALSRCTNIGFKRDTNEFRSCVTEQIKILSK